MSLFLDYGAFRVHRRRQLIHFVDVSRVRGLADIRPGTRRVFVARRIRWATFADGFLGAFVNDLATGSIVALERLFVSLEVRH